MTKLQQGGASTGGRGKKGAQKGSNCFSVVKMIMERQYQPVIVFSFSRRDCEAYALQMSKLDFNTRKTLKQLFVVVAGRFFLEVLMIVCILWGSLLTALP